MAAVFMPCVFMDCSKTLNLNVPPLCNFLLFLNNDSATGQA